MELKQPRRRRRQLQLIKKKNNSFYEQNNGPASASLALFSTQSVKKIIFTACHSGKLKLAFSSQTSFQQGPKVF